MTSDPVDRHTEPPTHGAVNETAKRRRLAALDVDRHTEPPTRVGYVGHAPECIVLTFNAFAQESMPTTWRFAIFDREGNCMDYSLSSSRWFAWRMAKRQWRRLMREHRRKNP